MFLKKNAVSVLLLLVVFLQINLSFNVHKRAILAFRAINKKLHIIPSQYQIQKKLNVRYPVTEKKPLVIVIANYNNEKFCEKNLRSVFGQTYDNYRVIYIDDCSQDRTFEIAKNLVDESKLSDRFTMIRNKERRRKMANLYEAFHSCKDEEIIICLDGDDWFAHDNVLANYNNIYQNSDIWLTYGSAIFYPNYDRIIGSCLTDKQLLKQKVRDLDRFDICMPRTFYAGLFKQIKLKDFFYQEKYIEMSDDPAFMFPMIEMAGSHVKFCENVNYVINNINPISDHHVSEPLQTALRRFFQWEKEKYPIKDSSFSPTIASSSDLKKRIDLIVFSENTPLELEATLSSYTKKIKGLQDIYVVYSPLDLKKKQAYETLQKKFSDVTFLSIEDKLAIEKIFDPSNKKTSPYIALSQDNFVLKEPLDLINCAYALGDTKAISFLIAHMDKSCKRIRINNAFSALQLKSLPKVSDLIYQETFCLVQKAPIADAIKKNSLPVSEINKAYHLNLVNQEELVLLLNEETFLTLHDPSAPEKGLNSSDLLRFFNEGKTVDLTAYIDNNCRELTEEYITSQTEANQLALSSK